MSRRSNIERTTGETSITLVLNLDGPEEGTRETGIGFFDHMLDLLARHSGLGLTVNATGDLETGAHHTVEDVGICLGRALDEALGDRSGINRYGYAVIPMDEARAAATIDLSGRPFAAVDVTLPDGLTGGFEHDLLEEFMRAVASNGRLTLHIEEQRAGGAHHLIEASFKAFARALKIAVAVDPLGSGVPSTKGTLS
ncbi:MAG: imidazoleglycerol-phosphate dehydratase HisB [Solirubrobacterales bacterium]|nr:imidazoleglycerol-phosphate dehydratase HisB [Solirubrobacterales bacterium]